MSRVRFFLTFWNSYIKDNPLLVGIYVLRMSIRRLDAEVGKMTLEFDNGDKEKFEQLMQNWRFKDEQSLIRFAMSVMLLTIDQTVTITTDDGDQKVKPANDFLIHTK